MSITIKELSVLDLSVVTEVLNQIPEFNELFETAFLINRIGPSQSIILTAEFAGKVVGCKLAYNRYFDGSIYSWLGGVLPYYREQGIAHQLQKELEFLAKKRFFNSVQMKTRNCHSKMIRFAIAHDYVITHFERKENLLESRIEMKKKL